MMKYIKKIDATRFSIMLGFGILYSLISLVNHYMFRTFAFDLGIFNQAMWDYAHFRITDNTVLQPQFGNLLSDHFELLLVVVSPLYYIFGSYTLLIVQIVAIIIGGQGIFKYVELISGKRKFAIAAMIQFFLFYGIFSALSFDFHNNVLGAMIVPWIFYFIQKKKLKQTIFLFVLFLISKENMALWGFFIFAGMMFMYRKDRGKLVLSAVLCITSLFYFLLIVKLVIPSLGTNPNGYLHFRYAVLGSNMTEAFATMITKPLYTIKLLFSNHLGNPKFDYIKAELHIAVLLSGVILLFFRPYYLIMLLPIYGQKLFCDYETYWGLSGHYSIEFIPIITIGAFSFINDIDSKKTRRIVTYTLIILTFAVSFRTFDKTYTHFNRQNIRFYQKPHYTREFSISEAYSALKMIPETAAVSAQNEFVSHLSFREKIYLFPAIEDAEYIVVSTKASYYPFATQKEFDAKLAAIEQSSDWEIIYDKNFMKILKKRTLKVAG